MAGLTLAWELTCRGAAVSLEDPAGRPGPHGCSWWAGGMLAPACERESAEEPVFRLGQEAADWWTAAGAVVRREGTLVLALGRDRAELTRFSRRAPGGRVLEGAEIAALEPDLEGRFSKALFFETEAHLDPREALATLVSNLRNRGVAIAAKSRASEATVDATGLAAKAALQDLRGVKGEMLVLRAPDVALRRPVRLLHPRFPLYIVPREDGVFMLGATMIEATERGRITARSMVELLNAAYALHPSFGEAEILEIGVDARPAFPDNLPRVRQIGEVIYVNGLFRHGFLLSPATARRAADYILDGRVAPDLVEA